MIISYKNLQSLSGTSFSGYLFGKSKEEAVTHVSKEIKSKGIEAIKHFNGSYCAHYINEEKKELYVFNDRLGMVDLYLLKFGTEWLITDRYWTAVQHLSSYTINDNAIQQLLSFGYMHWENTYLKEITLCKPASLITIDLNTNTIKKTDSYWRHQPAVGIINRKEAKEQMIEGIKKGVEESFNEPDSEYVLANSGGLDSRWNMHYAAELGKPFTAYTYTGKVNADAIHISKKINKILNQQNAQYVEISTGNFMPQYAAQHIENTPMLPSYSMWYFDVYKNISHGKVNINGFASTFLDAFTYMDKTGRYERYWKANEDEKYAYCFDTYIATDQKLIEAICKKSGFKTMKDEFFAVLNGLKIKDLGDVCDTFDFNCRQRRLNKNEPWTNFYGKMESRSPLLHNDLVDLSLQLPFDMRQNRMLYKEAARDVMVKFANIRFERSPLGLNGNKSRLTQKIKELVWRADIKMYKKTGRSLWFKGNHKDVATWMCQKENLAFIKSVFSTKNEHLSARFSQDYLLNNLQQLIKLDFVFISSLLTVFLFFIRLEDETNK